MDYKWNIIGEQGLQFFGKMSTSISHEIKNALAIINENAGLLKDYSLMADKGKSIDPERLKTLADKVMKQIRRADKIVENLNMFAHSVDESIQSVDLGDTVDFMSKLVARLAFIKSVTLEPKPAISPIIIMTNPFFLENLIWLCLDFAMNTAEDGKNIGLITEKTEQGAMIKFTHLQDLPKASLDKFPGEKEKALAEALDAEIAVNIDAGEIIITLPEDIDK